MRSGVKHGGGGAPSTILRADAPRMVPLPRSAGQENEGQRIKRVRAVFRKTHGVKGRDSSAQLQCL